MTGHDITIALNANGTYGWTSQGPEREIDMKRRVRLAHWLFDRSRTARTAFVLGIWPIVYVTDRWGLLGRVNPPARLRDGLLWAWHGDLPRVPTIPTSATPARVTRRSEHTR